MATSALAGETTHSVLFVNSDPNESMQVMVDRCEYRMASTNSADCTPLKTLNLARAGQRNNSETVTFQDPEDDAQISSLQVAKVTTSAGKQGQFGNKSCEGMRTGDVVLLSTHSTDKIICTRSLAGV